MTKTSRSLLALAATLGLAACATWSHPKAVAHMEPTRGNGAIGTVTLEQTSEGVVVTGDLTGLHPNQLHGFHVHEKGDCSSPDGLAAGGHFNPEGHHHGPQDGEHHAGDMPAIQSDDFGRARFTFKVKGVTLGSGPDDLVGHAFILHASPDDYATQPTGNSGARIACGVIRMG